MVLICYIVTNCLIRNQQTTALCPDISSLWGIFCFNVGSSAVITRQILITAVYFDNKHFKQCQQATT